MKMVKLDRKRPGSSKGEIMTTYKRSGVDVKLADKFTEFLQKKSKAIGGFAGLFPVAESGDKYNIVASTDGVGTKLKLAFLLDKHDSIGIDLVAMCVNDLICCGARPAIFLDYYATGKLDLGRSKKIIDGIMEGCRQGESVLLGGETAEMPGFYRPGEYDLAGFSVGIVNNDELIDGSKILPGDVVIGLKSSGFHSNGYSLIRAALKGKGRTIAVLGAAIDQLYPPENGALADAIAGSGAVISEYPLGRPADRQTFPYRNRIISGLSMGVIVVEAGFKSGALHTSDAAMEQGRSVFAVPGRIDSPASKGTNHLIKNGAKLVDNVGDILEEFELLVPPGQFEKPLNTPSARPEVPLSEEEQVLVKALWDEALDVDSLARSAGLPSAKVSALLIGLEMKRVVKMLPGRVVELAEDLRN